MKNQWIKVSAFLALTFLIITAFSQEHHVREQDHFWRKRIVTRIDLGEKINQPLVHHASTYYADDSYYAETDGIVVALINGLKEGKYLAYHPDKPKESLSFEDLMDRVEEFEQATYAEEEEFAEDEAEVINDDFGPAAEEWDFDDFNDEEWEEIEDPTGGADLPASDQPLPDLGPYEVVIHMIEDWIFDRQNSRMIQQPKMFEIIWSDPAELLPEKVLCRFKWQDVQDQLDQTQWKNRFNDAETRSIREVLAMRIFHGIIVEVGGQPVASLSEAEKRRLEIVEFEHNLWSY